MRTRIKQLIDHKRMIVTMIDITWISGMIFGVMTIEEMITIIAKMSIDITTVLKIGRAIIAVMVGIMIVIIHLKEIMVTDNHIEEVVFTKIKSLIIFGGQMIIIKEIDGSMITRSPRGLNNFSMRLGREKIPIRRMFGVLNMKLVNQVVHRYRIVTYAGKTIIMQMNVLQEKKGRHQPLIWLCPKFNK